MLMISRKLFYDKILLCFKLTVGTVLNSLIVVLIIFVCLSKQTMALQDDSPRELKFFLLHSFITEDIK